MTDVALPFLRSAFETENYICEDDLLITVSLALKLGRPLLIEGNEDNLKVTTPADLARFEYILSQRGL